MGRGHEHLVDILGLDKAEGGFAGVIQCDGYSAYDALAKRYLGIRLGGCLAHIRRKFYESQKQAPEVVLPLLRLMQEPYRIKELLRQSGAPPNCRELIRRSWSGPVVEGIYQKLLIERARHLPQSNQGKALSYALNQ